MIFAPQIQAEAGFNVTEIFFYRHCKFRDENTKERDLKEDKGKWKSQQLRQSVHWMLGDKIYHPNDRNATPVVKTNKQTTNYALLVFHCGAIIKQTNSVSQFSVLQFIDYIFVDSSSSSRKLCVDQSESLDISEIMVHWFQKKVDKNRLLIFRQSLLYESLWLAHDQLHTDQPQ